MAEYIKKDTIEKFIKDGLNNPDKSKAFGHDAIEILEEIYFFPAADVEEVKHGRWIEQTAPRWQTWYCSECKILGSPQWKRCPVCEAKMDGGKENG